MDYVSKINERIAGHRDIVLYISDRRAEILFCICLQFGIHLTAMCEDNEVSFRIGLRDADYIPVISEQQLAQMNNPAILVSSEKHDKLTSDHRILAGASYYLYDAGLRSCYIPAEHNLLNINERLREKPVIIYGCGLYGKNMQEWLRGMKLEPYRCCDSNLALRGSSFYGTEIISPDMLGEYIGKAYVIVTPLEWNGVFRTLKALGFEPDDVFQDVVVVGNRQTDILKPWLLKKNENIVKESLYKILEYYRIGSMIAQRLKQNADTEYYFAGPVIGDLGLIASKMKAVKQIHGFDRICIICLDRVRNIPRLFSSVDEVLGLGDFEYCALQYYFYITRSYHEANLHFAFYQYQNCFSEYEVGGHVAKLSKTWWELLEEWVCIPHGAVVEMTSPDFVDLSILRKDLEDKNLSNAILLMSQSQTTKEYLDKDSKNLTMLFFKKLADQLQECGFTVYSNCPKGFKLPPEEYVEGTVLLETSPEELVRISQELKGVVAVRSGMQEMLSLTKECHLSIICENIPKDVRKSFDCNDFVQRENMQSYQLEKDNMDLIVREIVEALKQHV